MDLDSRKKSIQNKKMRLNSFEMQEVRETDRKEAVVRFSHLVDRKNR